MHTDLKVRWLAEDEIESGRAVVTKDNRRLYRLRLKKEDFLEHGFTEGCPGCQAIIAGTPARGHSERCRSRMQNALDTTDDGRQRRERQTARENEALARKLQEEDERMSKKVKTSDDNVATTTSAAGAPSSSSKRWADAEDDADKSPNTKRHRGLQSRRGVKRELEHQDENERDDEDVDIANVEGNIFQDDMKWTVNIVSDLCIPEDPAIKTAMDDMAHYDENTWERLDQHLVEEGEKAELARFKKMGVYSYVRRSEAVNDLDGTFVKVKWVRTNKGTLAQPNIKCRLVAQELGYGQRIDELFSCTPSLMTMKMALIHAAKGERGIMVMDVKERFSLR